MDYWFPLHLQCLFFKWTTLTYIPRGNQKDTNRKYFQKVFLSSGLTSRDSNEKKLCPERCKGWKVLNTFFMSLAVFLEFKIFLNLFSCLYKYPWIKLFVGHILSKLFNTYMFKGGWILEGFLFDSNLHRKVPNHNPEQYPLEKILRVWIWLF